MGFWLGLMLMAGGQAVPPIPPLAGKLPDDDKPAAAPRERPRGRLFISPMGEPFRGPDPIGMWFDGADTNHDGELTLAEFTADADRFFLRLDRGHDGEIDPDDIDYYETVLAPEIRTGGEGGMAAGRPGGGGGGGGAGAAGVVDMAAGVAAWAVVGAETAHRAAATRSRATQTSNAVPRASRSSIIPSR